MLGGRKRYFRLLSSDQGRLTLNHGGVLLSDGVWVGESQRTQDSAGARIPRNGLVFWRADEISVLSWPRREPATALLKATCYGFGVADDALAGAP